MAFKEFYLERQFCIINAKRGLSRDSALPYFERMILSSQIGVVGSEETDNRDLHYSEGNQREKIQWEQLHRHTSPAV